jgi:hypothetical protein
MEAFALYLEGFDIHTLEEVEREENLGPIDDPHEAVSNECAVEVNIDNYEEDLYNSALHLNMSCKGEECVNYILSAFNFL